MENSFSIYYCYQGGGGGVWGSIYTPSFLLTEALYDKANSDKVHSDKAEKYHDEAQYDKRHLKIKM